MAIFITATGLTCPVGLNTRAACAAMRAGVSGFEDLGYADSRREPVVGAPIPGLELGLKRGARLVRMLGTAVAECVQGYAGSLAEVPLFVGLAEPGRPGGGADLAETILDGVRDAVGVRFHPSASRAIAAGHTAPFEGLKAAREAIDAGAPGVLVAGVDSYVNAATLAWLERQGRLKTSDTSNGVIPGEAAAAVLLTPRPAGQAVLVAGLGFATETVPVLSEEPFLGHGLVAATRQALADARLPLHEIDFRLSDVTGESYAFKEQALMLSRVMRGRKPGFPLWHGAEAVGDTGAAAGVVHLIRASSAFRGGYAPGPRAVVFGSGVAGARAVAVLRYDLEAEGVGS